MIRDLFVCLLLVCVCVLFLRTCACGRNEACLHYLPSFCDLGINVVLIIRANYTGARI